MSFRTFILGLTASFGVAWLAIIVVPFFKMRSLAPIAHPEAKLTTAGFFYPKRTGRVAAGAQVYGENGCYVCHTQLVRPTYAGNDIFRPDWGGLKMDPDRGDTRRETNAFDFYGEKFAHIGQMRIGPDLSNVGRRVTIAEESSARPEAWLMAHLYNPRSNRKNWDSKCPSHRFMFEEREVKNQPSVDAVAVKNDGRTEVVPGPDARALVSYLMSLRKDHAVPAALNFAPPEEN
jgi:cytochrome c oxidase cbb3-type subunit II